MVRHICSASAVRFSGQLTRIPPIRPLTDRDILYVQEFVRVTGSEDRNASNRWWYTYNQSVEHPYFASRPGFVRVKMKYQGMVGVVGDGGKTRLTWMVNYDLGGILPSSFATALLVSLMALPIHVLEDTKDRVKKREDEVTDIVKSSLAQEDHSHGTAVVSRKVFEELQEKLKSSERRNEVLRDENKLLRDELTDSLGEKEREIELALEEKDKDHERTIAEKDEQLKKKVVELAAKDEELRSKDVELQRAVSEIMELRRRLPREDNSNF